MCTSLAVIKDNELSVLSRAASACGYANKHLFVMWWRAALIQAEFYDPDTLKKKN